MFYIIVKICIKCLKFPNIGFTKKHSSSGNVQYPLMNQMMVNNMGNNMIFGYNNNFIS